ncbi:ABC transporter permease [Promicromonospora soli]
MNDIVTALVAGGVAFAVPMFLAASGELVSERAGVLNLSVDGMILVGAFSGALVAMHTDSAPFGVAGAIAAAVVLAALQAVLSVHLRANQLITGIALNALALGATSYGARLAFADGGADEVPGFDSVSVPLLNRIPILGQALFHESLLTYAAVGMAIAVALVVSPRRPWGLVIDAVGEDPVVADHAGVRVGLVRWCVILLTGGSAGLAGALLALSELRGFTEGMTAGMGYVAIVAVIAGSWKVGRVAVACAVFGTAHALEFAMPTLGVDVPVALLVMSPYVIALVAVSGLVGRNRGPAALTKPFVRVGA